MTDENTTRETFSTATYQEVTPVESKKRPSDSTSLEGRLLSTRKTTGDVKVRVTTRPVTVRQTTK